MQKFILYSIITLLSSICFGQRIVNNRILVDIDDSFNEVDTVVLKNNLSVVNCYQCNKRENTKDSCILYLRKTYDKSGRLIELIKGDNLTENKIDYIVDFKKVSGLLYEATANYPPDSKMIPDDFFVDTVIKRTAKRVCLYKSDKNKYIPVKSVYALDSNGNLKDIKRYDVDNRLVQVYYPFGNRRPKKEWSDVSVNEKDSTIIHYSLYDENEFIMSYVYSKQGKIVETKEVINTFSNGDSSLIRKLIIYDSEGQPIIRMTVNENSQLISEERFYYSGSVLVKYTEDDNVNDSILGEEKIFNLAGQLVLYKSYNRYSGSKTMWKYYYDAKGLLKKEEYFLDEIPQLTRMYSYQ